MQDSQFNFWAVFFIGFASFFVLMIIAFFMFKWLLTTAKKDIQKEAPNKVETEASMEALAHLPETLTEVNLQKWELEKLERELKGIRRILLNLHHLGISLPHISASMSVSKGVISELIYKSKITKGKIPKNHIQEIEEDWFRTDKEIPEDLAEQIAEVMPERDEEEIPKSNTDQELKENPIYQRWREDPRITLNPKGNQGPIKNN